MEAGERVVVHLIPVPGGPSQNPHHSSNVVRGALALPYDGEGSIHLRATGGRRRIVPAEQVRWVDTDNRDR